MDFLRKNLFVSILSVILIVLTAVLCVVISTYRGDLQKYEKLVDDIMKAEKSFANVKYALTDENKGQATSNYEHAKSVYEQLIKKLREKYPEPAVGNDDMTPLKFKLHLQQSCIRMENLLRSGDIWMPDALKYFSFDEFMKEDRMTTNDEIDAILRQLEIVQEIMYLISQSQVNKLLDFQRLNKLDSVKRDLYNYMPFSLSLSGNVEAIRSLINSLHTSNLLLVLRDINIKAEQPRMAGAPKPASGDNPPLSKNSRLVFMNDAKLSVKITLDYLTFNAQE